MATGHKLTREMILMVEDVCGRYIPTDDFGAVQLTALVNRELTYEDYYPGLTIMGLRGLLYDMRRWAAVYDAGDHPNLKMWTSAFERYYEKRKAGRKR
jgi:hypothetical protein